MRACPVPSFAHDAVGRFVLVHEQSRREVAIRHQFDVDFREFEVASVDSPAASNAKLQERSVDATTDASKESVKMASVFTPTRL